ncbi:MAG: GNAT family N-acetyltransferase [Clostridia bacterium]|nr:GNAT family N-acetyltransferase [Clostridia bacterium]
MQIIEYNSQYDEQIKDLLVELQNYLIDIDDWHTQVMLPEYREKNFQMDMRKVNNQEGKIFLAIENDLIVGLIMGIVEEKDEIDKLTNDCAKTGSVIELIVKNNIRGNGIGKILLEEMEEYFKNIFCKRVNIEVFGPNKKGLNFYEKNGYISRDIIVSKKLN